MSLVEANGIGVVSADFILPISRAWHVDLTASTAAASTLTGPVLISIGGALVLKGTGTADVYLDTVRARVIAGAGGLAKPTMPRSYQQVSVGIVLGDLLSAAGEVLSGTADGATLGQELPNWTVSQMNVADAIALLMDHAGASWRMLVDGTFWCGQETWPDSGLSYSLEQEDKAHQQVVISSEAPLLLPGQSLDGRHISYVESHVDASTTRSVAWLATAASADRMRDPMVGLVRSATPHVDYLALYRAKVVSQTGGSFDLIPDDPRLPTTGLSQVPLRNGIPGYSCQIVPGASVLLGWMNGDQSAPYCMAFEGGETVLTAAIAATILNLGAVGAIDALIKGTSFIAILQTFLTGLNTYLAAMNTAFGGLSTATSFGDVNTAATPISSAGNTFAGPGGVMTALQAALPTTLSTQVMTI